MNVLHSSNTPEWYTPKSIIDLARKALGEIDLDPASNEVAQEWIQAKHYYTKNNDGLSKDWFGNVWLNPPYGNSLTKTWVNKLLQEYKNGNVKQAIVLVRPAISANWFNDLAIKYWRCETYKRIRFIDYQGCEQPHPAHGNVLFYLGDNNVEFADVFHEIGIISCPVWR